jgi:hypothetical protein
VTSDSAASCTPANEKYAFDAAYIAGFGSMHQVAVINDDGWIVLQVTICSEPDESGIHLSLQQAMQV